MSSICGLGNKCKSLELQHLENTTHPHINFFLVKYGQKIGTDFYFEDRDLKKYQIEESELLKDQLLMLLTNWDSGIVYSVSEKVQAFIRKHPLPTLPPGINDSAPCSSTQAIAYLSNQSSSLSSNKLLPDNLKSIEDNKAHSDKSGLCENSASQSSSSQQHDNIQQTASSTNQPEDDGLDFKLDCMVCKKMFPAKEITNHESSNFESTTCSDDDDSDGSIERLEPLIHPSASQFYYKFGLSSNQWVYFITLMVLQCPICKFLYYTSLKGGRKKYCYPKTLACSTPDCVGVCRVSWFLPRHIRGGGVFLRSFRKFRNILKKCYLDLGPNFLRLVLELRLALEAYMRDNRLELRAGGWEIARNFSDSCVSNFITKFPARGFKASVSGNSLYLAGLNKLNRLQAIIERNSSCGTISVEMYVSVFCNRINSRLDSLASQLSPAERTNSSSSTPPNAPKKQNVAALCLTPEPCADSLNSQLSPPDRANSFPSVPPNAPKIPTVHSMIKPCANSLSQVSGQHMTLPTGSPPDIKPTVHKMQSDKENIREIPHPASLACQKIEEYEAAYKDYREVRKRLKKQRNECQKCHPYLRNYREVRSKMLKLYDETKSICSEHGRTIPQP